MYKSTKSPKSWQKIINTYEKSNLSKSEFCNENQLPANKFYYWCNKLRPDLKSELHVNAGSKKSSFLPIKTTADRKIFSISLNNGLKINFDSIPEALWIARLINSIGELHDQH